MRKAVFVIAVALLAGALDACKPGVPRQYIQPDDMEDILYDWLVAQNMAEDDDGDDEEDGTNGGGRDYRMHAYKLEVLRMHGVTEEDFDTALVYYTRHADRLNKIYADIEKRLEGQALALGADAREVSRYGTNVAEGDTVNLWQGETSMILSRRAPMNRFQWTIAGDSTWKKGDKFVLSFDTRFMIEQGSRGGTALLAIVFDNDSVASRTTQLRKNSHQGTELTVNDSVGIRELRGFIYLGDDEKAGETAVRMMVVENLKIVKMKRPARKGNVDDDGGNDKLAVKPVKTRHTDNNDSVPKPVKR